MIVLEPISKLFEKSCELHETEEVGGMSAPVRRRQIGYVCQWGRSLRRACALLKVAAIFSPSSNGAGSGITGGLSGADAEENRPTIGLPEIGPMVRAESRRCRRRTGNLAAAARAVGGARRDDRLAHLGSWSSPQVCACSYSLFTGVLDVATTFHCPLLCDQTCRLRWASLPFVPCVMIATSLLRNVTL